MGSSQQRYARRQAAFRATFLRLLRVTARPVVRSMSRSRSNCATAYFFQSCDAHADIDGVPSQSVEFGDDQHIAFLHFVEQARKSFALRNGHRTGHGFRDDPVRLDSEARRFDHPDLISGLLLDGRDSGVGEGSGTTSTSNVNSKKPLTRRPRKICTASSQHIHRCHGRTSTCSASTISPTRSSGTPLESSP